MRRLVREMSITHAEFFRLLPAAIAGMPYSGSGLRVEAEHGGRKISIELSEQRSLRIGSLSLPAVVVAMECEGFDDREWKAFLSRFDLTFQRGGG